ncbi:hypothetical protein RBI69_05150 [Citrobacter portucalensis]|nr:hypothetical protein [Citrobacter portucalensis]
MEAEDLSALKTGIQAVISALPTRWDIWLKSCYPVVVVEVVTLSS